MVRETKVLGLNIVAPSSLDCTVIINNSLVLTSFSILMTSLLASYCGTFQSSGQDETQRPVLAAICDRMLVQV